MLDEVRAIAHGNPEEPEIWVCRDILGDHAGGPECFCDPYRILADDPRTTDQIIADIEARERKQ